MNKKYFFLVIIFSQYFIAIGQNASNMSLFGQFDRGDDRYSGSWAYIDSETGREYALLGTTSGTAIYDITETPIKEVAYIEGAYSRWREISVIGTSAYVVTEGEGQGMQVIDLANLPNSVDLVANYKRTFTTGHIIQRDIYSESPYVYVSGTCGSCGVNIIDVSKPSQPEEVGNYLPGYYIHDCHVKGDFLYAVAFFNGTIDIVDIKDKTNPTLLAQIEVSGGYTHSVWSTEDNKYLLISAERDGLPARIWNIEDLDNMFEVATYTSNEKSLTHNPYVRGDFAFFSHNTEGIRVVDIKDPSLPIEVAYYDTYSGASGGFSGLWSACPYFPSGKIIGGNREDGLYIWTFNNTAANRIYLTIRDTNTQEIIETATVQIGGNDKPLTADRDGRIKYGTLEKELEIEISAEGFSSKKITIQFQEGEQLSLDISLQKGIVSASEVANALPRIKVYPNPFQTRTIFDLSPLLQAETFVLIDPLSRVVDKRKITNSSFFQLERGTLPTGIYHYAIYNKSQLLVAKGKLVKRIK